MQPFESVPAFPLAWPTGRPRSKSRTEAPFGQRVQRDGQAWKSLEKLPIEAAHRQLADELRRLGARQPVISTNLKLRLDGAPYAGQGNPSDPGVAVYFATDDGPRCIAIDRFFRVADNLSAIAKSIEAIRGLDRWGGGQMVTAAFSGFVALPAPGESSNDVRTVEEAAAFLATVCGENALTAERIVTHDTSYLDRYREAAKKLHPDRNNGEATPEWHKLQSAKSLLDKHHRRS